MESVPKTLVVLFPLHRKYSPLFSFLGFQFIPIVADRFVTRISLDEVLVAKEILKKQK